MRILGLDFDNTLVIYDRIFHEIAIERKLISRCTPIDKTAIRDELRKQGKDDQFTLLQGEVYGKRILEADPAAGMVLALRKIRERGISMVIVSHKTRIPYKGPEYNLHQAAWDWLEKNEFFDHNGLNLSRDKVFFEETKEKKVARIQELNCTHYIDDLEPILEMIPEQITRIKYGKLSNKGKNAGIREMNDWSELCGHLRG